jgi:peptide/nickel transport system ATP-binding protein/oligopeptide transport system ATP-binding protein
LPLLEAEEITVTFAPRKSAQPFTAVSKASLSLAAGESLGVVGESGAGKTTLARCLAGLRQPTSGSVKHRGVVVNAADQPIQMPRVRGVQVVFQDPGASLNPRRRIDSLLREVLHVHHICPPEAETKRVAELLAEVGLPASLGERRPGTISGGQQQRAAIARALAFEPEVLIADEAVSSLDASVQAQILNLLADLRASRELAIVMVSHDTAVIRQLCDQVAVMYRGEIVESGATESVFAEAQHEYTRALLDAVPRWDLDAIAPTTTTTTTTTTTAARRP